MKRKLALILSLVILLSGIAILPAGATEGKSIIFAVTNEADGYDPGVTSNSFASPVLANCFESLTAYNANSEIVPGMAESWTISDDGLVYTFTLREGLKWSDGDPITANDYMYSWQRVLTPATAAQYYNMMTDYVAGAQEYYAALEAGGEADFATVGFKAPDEKTIEITLKAPCPYYLDLLGMWCYMPVKQAAVESSENWSLSADTYVTNGAYKVAEFKFAESVRLVKNENYYGAADVEIEEILLRQIPDLATALTAFENGEIDGQWEIPSEDVARLRMEDSGLVAVPAFGTSFYMFNFTREIFQDVRIRQALSLAIDRQQLVDSVLQTPDMPSFGMVSPGYMVDGVDYTEIRGDFGLSDTAANIAKAQELLAEAGYPGGEGFPTLQLGYYVNPIIKKQTEAIQQMWKQNLGIEMEIYTKEWGVYKPELEAQQFDIAATGWGGDYLHPMTYLPNWMTENMLNDARYSNPEYDALVTQAMSITDPVEGAKVMAEAENLFIGTDMAAIVVYNRTKLFMMSKRIEGVYCVMSRIYFKDAKIVG